MIKLIIKRIIWLEEFIEKIYLKHNVKQKEVYEILFGNTLYRFVEKGHRKNENIFVGLGKTPNERYLIVFFVYKKDGSVLVISARDMTKKEKKHYDNEK
ncbi:MAG: hypothetical protein HeimC3_39090 [Candidatus Heimdallarchaeota archaeon LC_3]|nr:MAG: hypothetical protein HeimC3_39090 [Candidatus Heimdallarchaeota archaeon LC_3]